MNFWTWSGRYVGYRSGDYLYSVNGIPLGAFYGEELYSTSGKYIGEIMHNDRLIVNKSSKTKRKPSRSIPQGSCASRLSSSGGYAMLSGYEDFVVK